MSSFSGNCNARQTRLQPKENSSVRESENVEDNCITDKISRNRQNAFGFNEDPPKMR
jgi:hypothetical protein